MSRWYAQFVALLLIAVATIGPAWASQPPAPEEQGAGPSPAGHTVTGKRAGERILSYLSVVTINRDASLSIVDTIRVRAEGSQIRHGIYRDFPTRYDAESRTIRALVQIQNVSRNGRSEIHRPERIDNGFRVWIGDAAVPLPPGEHIYEIRYTARSQIISLGGHDQLRWDVTGAWPFSIDRAEATVRLPRRVRFSSRDVETGGQAADGRNAEVIFERPGEIRLRTLGPLNSYEGLIVTVTWPAGVVEASPPR